MTLDLEKFLLRYERAIPVVLFLLFVLVTVPGISWGAPDLWNPDELFWRVNMALGGEMKFDESEPDFNYPSLPKHVMYGVGWLVQAAGGDQVAVLVAARLVSVVLGGLVILLVYALARQASESLWVRLLAAFLTLSSTALVHNARFAHNDLYLLFFTTLALYGLVRYRLDGGRLWLYLAFFATGCAASSKYTGVSFLAVLLLFFVVENWSSARKDWLRALETLAIAGGLTVAGYVIGTPKALLWMSFYFKRMIPAALRFASYGRGPDSVIGFYGQWGTFLEAVGTWVYYLFLASLVWAAVKLVLHALGRRREEPRRMRVIATLFVAILVFDLPFWFSYNYVPRFFLPFLPMFAILAGLAVEDLVAWLRAQGYPRAATAAGLLLALVIASSFLNVLSVVLLFANDARTPAGEFIQTLEPGTVIEYTLYPPSFPTEPFARARNYPIYLVKYPGETVPTHKAFPYNKGEDGLYERGVDYLVADSFTYARFSDEYICETNPVECEFFRELLAGETGLTLLASFEYSLPPWLPQISLAAVNPDVRVYRVPR